MNVEVNNNISFKNHNNIRFIYAMSPNVKCLAWKRSHLWDSLHETPVLLLFFAIGITHSSRVRLMWHCIANKYANVLRVFYGRPWTWNIRLYVVVFSLRSFRCFQKTLKNRLQSRVSTFWCMGCQRFTCCHLFSWQDASELYGGVCWLDAVRLGNALCKRQRCSAVGFG
jgi:hypothetical protein